MNFHGRMMNIPADPRACAAASDSMGPGTLGERCYKLGHRDARHAAAEIANEADRCLEILEEENKRLHQTVADLKSANDSVQATNNGLRGFIGQCERAFSPLAGKYYDQLDSAIGALVRDLKEKGLLNEMTGEQP